jgi:hypothetical protein
VGDNYTIVPSHSPPIVKPRGEDAAQSILSISTDVHGLHPSKPVDKVTCMASCNAGQWTYTCYEHSMVQSEFKFMSMNPS